MYYSVGFSVCVYLPKVTKLYISSLKSEKSQDFVPVIILDVAQYDFEWKHIVLKVQYRPHQFMGITKLRISCTSDNIQAKHHCKIFIILVEQN